MLDLPANWESISIKDFDRELPSKLKYTPVLIRLLASRGIIAEDDILSFLNPTLRSLHDPMALPGIKKAITRLKKAIDKKESIMIFGDYDADGVISSALIYNFLKKLNVPVKAYIPDRFKDGYGLNLGFVKKITAEKSTTLLICVDCGTNDTDVMEYLEKSKSGIDVIACDHHTSSLQKNIKSDNYIIINPKLPGSKYPFKHLSGAGVTFKFIIALLRSMDEIQKKEFGKGYLKCLLDLVAISTISDVMPLTGENRIIVKIGLEILKDTKNPGMKKMIELALKDSIDINEYAIGFIIAPRLNASGRVKNAATSFELLTGKGEMLDRAAGELEAFNTERRKIQKDVLDEILKENDFTGILKNKKIFIARSERWNEGVLGIVASDIVKKFNIPAILLKQKEGRLKGSGRSNNTFDLFENLNSLKDLFEKFGGHKHACGLTMDISNYDIFCKKMVEITKKAIKDADLKKKFKFDAEINFKDINAGLLEELGLMRPFGIGNPKPCFITADCEVLEYRFLKNKRHLKLKLKNSGLEFGGIMFNISEEVKNIISTGKKINTLYNLEENHWAGVKTIQLMIQDLF